MKKPIKVLFISHSSGKYGAERSLLLLLRYLDRSCIDPIVVLPSSGHFKEEIERLNIRVYILKFVWWVGIKKRRVLENIIQLGYRIILGIPELIKLYKIIKYEKIDVVYSNTIVIFHGALSASIARIPHIWHIREIITDNPDLQCFFPDTLIFRLVLKWSNIVIANSNATANQFKNSISTRKIRVIYNAVELVKIKVTDPFISIDGASAQDWIVTVVGNLQRRKAADDAIRAVKIAAERIPNIKLLLIGNGNDSYVNYLKRMVYELNISDKVIFAGFRRDVAQILAHCNACLIPSWNEPFGRSTIEAMAAGIPVIGSNSGGTKEIIDDGITGYLVPPHNPQKMAEKIIELYNHPELAKKIGNSGKRIAKEKFAPQSYARSIENVIINELT